MSAQPDLPWTVTRTLRAVRALLSTRASHGGASVQATTLYELCHAACAATGHVTPARPGSPQQETCWDADTVMFLIVQRYHVCAQTGTPATNTRPQAFPLAGLLSVLDALVS